MRPVFILRNVFYEIRNTEYEKTFSTQVAKKTTHLYSE